MVWKHNSRIIQVGKSWIGDDNTKYPNQWINLTTSEKNAASLVWEDDPTPLAKYDSFYYYGWNSDGDALLPKPLADIPIITCTINIFYSNTKWDNCIQNSSKNKLWSIKNSYK